MKSITEVNLKALTKDTDYTPSPIDWENQIIYFLLVDRFSDGNEDNYEPYNPKRDYENIYKDGDEEQWETWADRWNGGTIKGIQSKLNYLKDLGITTIWLSPIFKQPVFQENYHGYGIQNFLAIDPHLGTEEDLIALVEQAHQKDMYVILDIIINHTGDVFGYESPGPQYTGETFDVKGYRNSNGEPTLPFEQNKDYSIESAVWPVELQTPETFYKKGEIQDWEEYPEYVEGDFMSLKTINLGNCEDEMFDAPKSLKTLTEAYKYWIALTDVDGFRIDTVKHVEWTATNYFTQSIHEFTKSIGKDNFYLIGEITGGMEFAYNTMKKTGLDAALGINNIPNNMEEVAKGRRQPEDYFNIFSNSEFLGEDEYLWYKDNVVTMFDDHDMVSLGEEEKYRFAADKESEALLPNCLFMNVFTSGIPCLYYGTEQGFDGHGASDKYIRENMFGKKFGAFRSQNRHFFNKENPIYQSLADILEIRKQHLALKHGRQFLRKISDDGENFSIPQKLSHEKILSGICWSKIFNNEEFVLGINTDTEKNQDIYVMIDPGLNEIGQTYDYLYSSAKEMIGQTTEVIECNEKKAIKVNIPPSGRIILKMKS